MTVQLTLNNSCNQKISNASPINDTISNGSAIRLYDAQENVPKKVKIGVFLTTLIGVASTLAMTFKGKYPDISLNPLKIIKTNPLKWKIFHSKFGEDEIPKLVAKVAVGSVGGGLIGGALFDKKENMKAKFREAIIQMVGNIATPLVCVIGGMKLYDNKIGPKLVKALKLGERGAKVPMVIASGISLLTGIFIGNKIGNFINQKAFKINEDRKIKLSDMSPHIDDLCLALTLIGIKGVIGDFVTRLIPAALVIAGFSTGTAQEHVHNPKLNATASSPTKVAE